jgi:hypothetical protein
MLAEINIEPCTFSVSSSVDAMKYACRMHALILHTSATLSGSNA